MCIECTSSSAGLSDKKSWWEAHKKTKNKQTMLVPQISVCSEYTSFPSQKRKTLISSDSHLDKKNAHGTVLEHFMYISLESTKNAMKKTSESCIKKFSQFICKSLLAAFLALYCGRMVPGHPSFVCPKYLPGKKCNKIEKVWLGQPAFKSTCIKTLYFNRLELSAIATLIQDFYK